MRIRNFTAIVALSNLLGCSQGAPDLSHEMLGTTSSALGSLTDFVVCANRCAEAFDGRPGAQFPVYVTKERVAIDGGTEERVTGAFLMKCGAQAGDAAEAFGYERTTTTVTLPTLNSYESVQALVAALGGIAPISVDCNQSPFERVYRRIDVKHSAQTPAYYVELKSELVQEAAAHGGVPPSLYALDCSNTLTKLWDKAVVASDLAEALDAHATPINGEVVREWKEVQRHAVPTLRCVEDVRKELPEPSTRLQASVPPRADGPSELYFVRGSLDGNENPNGSYYLISNGLGYVVAGCGANIRTLKEALGIENSQRVEELPRDSQKFLDSQPGAQPVLHCNDNSVRSFLTMNGRPYRYFQVSGETKGLIRFTCESVEKYFLSSASSSTAPAVPEDSLPYLFGPNSKTKLLDISCPLDIRMSPKDDVLEVFQRGEWRGVCDDGFGMREAEVACRNMGYKSVESLQGGVASVSSSYWLEGVNCVGTEGKLIECPRAELGTRGCGKGDHVRVKCTNEPKTYAALRSNQAQSGSLEALLQGQWHPICDDSFDMQAANVACRELGYRKAKAVKTDIEAASNTYLLDDLKCSGNESRLSECQHSPMGTDDCGSSEHVSVRCSNAKECRLRHEGAFLVNGLGRVDVGESIDNRILDSTREGLSQACQAPVCADDTRFVCRKTDAVKENGVWVGTYDCECEPLEFEWSSEGAIEGLNCSQIGESTSLFGTTQDPNGWSNNYLCSNWDLKLMWAPLRFPFPNAGRVMISEPKDTHHGAEWTGLLLSMGLPSADNMVAFYRLGIEWSHQGPIADKNCVQWTEEEEPAESGWNDNYLCWKRSAVTNN